MRKELYDAEGNTVSIRGTWLASLAIVGALGLGTGMLITSITSRGGKPSEDDTSSQVTLTVTADEVIQTFEDNELRGKELYTGKRAQITGVVEHVGETSGRAFVTLKNSNDSHSLIELQCFFKDPTSLSNLVEGQSVTLVGTIGGLSVDISVEDCRFLPSNMTLPKWNHA